LPVDWQKSELNKMQNFQNWSGALYGKVLIVDAAAFRRVSYLYRDLVRDVQLGKSNILHGGMYEIPAAISVGSTVSAYNKRARMVQRGVVLLQDKVKPGYKVLFDRKELGCEFCPDTDVARHGPPNLLIEPSNYAVDGSVIGNNNRSHVVEGSLPYGSARNLDIFYKKAQIKHNLDGEMLKSRTPKQEQLIEAVAEREALMKLLSYSLAFLFWWTKFEDQGLHQVCGATEKKKI